jgi:hypothetical protein
MQGCGGGGSGGDGGGAGGCGGGGGEFTNSTWNKTIRDTNVSQAAEVEDVVVVAAAEVSSPYLAFLAIRN